MSRNLVPLLSSANEHWLTPPAFLALVLAVMDHIDLDPATNRASLVAANDHCYVGERDGLKIPWIGNIFINPPYGDLIPLWTELMRLRAGDLRACQLISLLPARVDTAWCQRDIFASADAWVFWSGRITFWQVRADGTVGPCLGKDGKPMPAPFPSLVPYWGPDPVAFGRVFGRFGPLFIRTGDRRGIYTRKRYESLREAA